MTRPFELELYGQVCPVPLMKTKKMAENLKSGDQLIIKSDFTRSVRNIADWAEKNNFRVSISEGKNGSWEIEITKN
ncbi:TusA-related sulfurtransferase [Desulfitispora alkaliphila]|uniref:sulfurtransferase TusA family protein n=1 Tax=Desulfitispora alkaliphila TaxID=622674 RepID=UPI003D1F8B2B